MGELDVADLGRAVDAVAGVGVPWRTQNAGASYRPRVARTRFRWWASSPTLNGGVGSSGDDRGCRVAGFKPMASSSRSNNNRALTSAFPWV